MLLRGSEVYNKIISLSSSLGEEEEKQGMNAPGRKNIRLVNLKMSDT